MKLSRLSDRQLRRLVRNAEVRFAIPRSSFQYVKGGPQRAKELEETIKKLRNMAYKTRFKWGEVVSNYMDMKSIASAKLPQSSFLRKFEKECDEVIKRLKSAYDIMSGFEADFYIDENK